MADRMDDWQRADFEALDPAWRAVAGESGASDCRRRAWLERPRGHSKTNDIATMAAWALFASRWPIRGVVAAADQDQARLLADAMLRLCRLNPWLGRLLDVQRDRVRNKHTEAELRIITSDAATSYGLTPDFVICDELAHWRKRDLWDSLFSAAAKRERCLLLVISNAGFVDSWQWSLRENVRADEAWHFSRLDGPRASWISAEQLDEQRRLLPDIVFQRLWLNEWGSGSGDALSSDDIDSAITLDGPSDAGEGWRYVAGLDLGLSRDASALVVIGKHVGRFDELRRRPRLSSRDRMLIEAGMMDEPEPEFIQRDESGTGRLKLASVRVWRPEGGRRVDIESIERSIARLDRRYRFASVAYDPWQATYLAERLAKSGIPASEVPFSGPNLRAMCSSVLEAFRERNIDLYPDSDLLRDLRRLRVIERSYGVRLDSPRGPDGHGDAATALALAIHAASGVDERAAASIEGPLLAYP